LSATGNPADAIPLTPPVAHGAGAARGCLLSEGQDPLPPPRVTACGFHESEAPSTDEAIAGHPHGHPPTCIATIGQRPQRPRVFIEVRQPLLDLRCSDALTSCSQAARASPASARRMFSRARPRTHRTSHDMASHVGDDRLIGDRESPLDLGDHRRYAGSGAEKNRPSALPDVIAHAEDFAPTPIASDIPCRGYRS
jgi:hypothetical protein